MIPIWIVGMLVIAASIFLLIASLGLLRLPDVYCRASAATKAATLGVGCLLAAVAVELDDPQVTARVIATAGFLMLTSPISAHLITRAAYRIGEPSGVPLETDELATGRRE